MTPTTGGPLGPDELRDLEERLRVALETEAREIVPADRLQQIRDDTRAAQQPGRPPWLWPLTAAAAVAAVALVVWVGFRPGDVAPPVVGATTSATSTTGGASSAVSPSVSPTTLVPPPPSTGTGTPGTASGTAPAAGTPTTVPVYFVEPLGADWRLAREFAVVPVGDPASRESIAEAAVDASLAGASRQSTTGVLQAWTSGTTAQVTLGGPQIRVVLSQAGRTGLSAAQQKIAVQQVVWAVTAGAQQNVPVALTVQGGGRVFETVPPGTFARPAKDLAWTEVAPVWIDAVTVGPSGVRVTGQACTFEATVAWSLRQGGAEVRKGHTTASSGCPVQGSWTVDLGTVPSGTYEFHALEYSAENGSVRADQMVTVTVP